MACAVAIDPRMMDLVWTDRLEYEALLYKRPSCTQAQPTSAPTSTVPTSVAPTSVAPTSAAKKSSKTPSSVCDDGKSLVAELEAARGFIRASLQPTVTVTTLDTLIDRATCLETRNASLRKLVEDLTKQIEKLEAKAKSTGVSPVVTSIPESKPAEKPVKKEESSDDDDFEFDDSDDDDDAPKESAMAKMKRLAAEKKAAEAATKKKAAPVLKSNVVIDVKPWDDETDMNDLEAAVRKIVMEGLVWGDSKFVDVGYGIKKLRISTCIIDDLVGLYELEDNITDLKDYVQSVDIVSHNKI